MLSERERRDLAEIERRLRGGDPALNRVFRRGAVRRWPYIVAIVLLALVLVGFVLLGEATAAWETLSLLAVAVAVAWWQLWS